MKTYNYCNNCGKNGHYFHQCKNPITSIGIIAFKVDDKNKINFLLIRRKDSLGYIDFMRGKYPIGNKSYLLNILQEMSIPERKRLLTEQFEALWKELWGDDLGIQYRTEERISREKFHNLKTGFSFTNDSYNLESLIKEVTDKWEEPEWGFPKGET